MTQLHILRYPDPRLHTVAQAVASVDARIQQLAQDMLETMYEADGVGLAATQVDVHLRMFVMDTSESRDQSVVLINPQIIERSADKRLGEEGCLSVPQIFDKVERSTWVVVRAQDTKGAWFDLRAEGLASVCVQHEIDHLDGKVFVEHLSSLKRDRIKTKLLKRVREAGADSSSR